jgi:hypothetical protein
VTKKWASQARQIALAVDKLFSENPKRFTDYIEKFKQEAAERQRLDGLPQKALDAVWAEALGVKKGKIGPKLKIKPRLTNFEERPGPGFAWFKGAHAVPCGRGRHTKSLQGWIPSDAMEVIRQRESPWPSPSPSEATMRTLLAALHDECLPSSPQTLDAATADAESAYKSKDEGNRALFHARQWVAVYPARRIPTLTTYLNAIVEQVKAEASPGRPDNRASGGRGLPVAVANHKVALYLVEHVALPPIRDLAKAVGCSIGTIQKTAMWREHVKTRAKPRAVRKVAADDAVDRDEALEHLVKEQQADCEPNCGPDTDPKTPAPKTFPRP